MKRFLAWLARLRGEPKYRVLYKPTEYGYEQWQVQRKRYFMWNKIATFREQSDADSYFDWITGLGNLVTRQSE